MDALYEAYILYCDLCGYRFVAQEEQEEGLTCPNCQAKLKCRHTWVSERLSGYKKKRGMRQMSTCTKIYYETKSDARKAAKALDKKSGSGRKMIAYKCRYCSGWHIGRQRKYGKPINNK